MPRRRAINFLQTLTSDTRIKHEVKQLEEAVSTKPNAIKNALTNKNPGLVQRMTEFVVFAILTWIKDWRIFTV